MGGRKGQEGSIVDVMDVVRGCVKTEICIKRWNGVY